MGVEEVLAFEREWLNRPQHDGAKMHAAYDRFGLSLVRYYQLLVAALEDPRAWAVDPVTCGVVRRRMEVAQRTSSVRRAALRRAG